MRFILQKSLRLSLSEVISHILPRSKPFAFSSDFYLAADGEVAYVCGIADCLQWQNVLLRADD